MFAGIANNFCEVLIGPLLPTSNAMKQLTEGQKEHTIDMSDHCESNMRAYARIGAAEVLRWACINTC